MRLKRHRRHPSRQWPARVVAVVVATAGTTLMVSLPAEAAPAADHLSRGAAMVNGQSFTRDNPTTDGYWTLTMYNGELIETIFPGYGRPARTCWQTAGTKGRGAQAIYQQDGNFVIYDSHGLAVWASNTVGVTGENVNINKYGQIYVGQNPISGICGG